MIALAFAPLGDVEKSQFFRPTTKRSGYYCFRLPWYFDVFPDRSRSSLLMTPRR